MIGGKTYKPSTFNRAHQIFRQPGSTIKPLLVYTPYLETSKNRSIHQKIDTSVICIEDYCLENYGHSTYSNLPLIQAMAKSVNTATVRFLQKTGIKESFLYPDKFGFKKSIPADRTYFAAVGSFRYGMSVLELSRAYTAFMNDSNYVTAHAIQHVTDSNGRLIYRWNMERRKYGVKIQQIKCKHF